MSPEMICQKDGLPCDPESKYCRRMDKTFTLSQNQSCNFIQRRPQKSAPTANEVE